MGRRAGSRDKTDRERMGRPGNWKASYKSEPEGKSQLTIRNIPNRILAALESDADQAGKSVQDVVRQQLEQKYPPSPLP